MCGRIEEVGPMVELPRHRHFVGFFNLPVQAPFYGCNHPISVAFYDAHGDTDDLFSS